MDEKEPNNSTLDLPLLITRGLLVFPNMTESIEASRAYSVAAIDNARGVTNSLLLIACQKDPSKTDVSDVNNEIFLTGTLCRIVNFVNSNSVYRIRVIGSKRVSLSNIRLENGTYIATGALIEDVLGDRNEEVALVRKIVESIEAAPALGSDIPKSALNQLGKGGASNDIADTLAAYLPITLEQKVKILAEPNVNTRLHDILDVIAQQKEIEAIDEKLNDTVRERAEKSQKEYFLREKMKAIKDELGEGEDDEENEDTIKEKLEKNPYPDNVKARVKSELHRYQIGRAHV